MHWLRCVRWPNLLIIAFIQCGIYYKIILPSVEGLPSVLDEFDFITLVLVTCTIAAAGYVINNIFDHELDSLSGKNPIPAFVSKKQACYLYGALVAVGAIMSLYLCLKTGYYYEGLLFPLATLGLFFYSYRLKCTMLLGNLFVAVFAGGVLLIILVAFRIPFYKLYETDIDLYNVVVQRILLLSAFASLSNLCREMVKDMEDVQSDSNAGCKTLPVLVGIQISAWVHLLFAGLLCTLLFLQCFGSSQSLYHKIIHLILGSAIIAGGIFLVIFPTAKTAANVSIIYKLIFVVGIVLYLFLPL